MPVVSGRPKIRLGPSAITLDSTSVMALPTLTLELDGLFSNSILTAESAEESVQSATRAQRY
eukprot:COSAG03_NODE_4161_length_1656_cov_3.524727_2_plen_62_part_00